MAEAAPPHRRGLYLSMQYATQDAAILVAGIVGTTLAAVLSPQQLQDWGWRVALLLGAVIVPFGIALRNTLPETLGEHHDEEPVIPPGAGGRTCPSSCSDS
jgi:MFS family permease